MYNFLNCIFAYSTKFDIKSIVTETDKINWLWSDPPPFKDQKSRDTLTSSVHLMALLWWRNNIITGCHSMLKRYMNMHLCLVHTNVSMSIWYFDMHILLEHINVSTYVNMILWYACQLRQYKCKYVNTVHWYASLFSTYKC